jgi:cob(I)alamin adenosyltransferase
MAEVATAPENRAKLKPGSSLVTPGMVEALEGHIDDLSSRFPPIKDFVIPGHDRVSAGLDLARTIARRAEREVLAVAALSDPGSGSEVGRYLNRLSDLIWAMARWQEQGDSLLSRRAHQAGRSAAGSAGNDRSPGKAD